MGAVKKILIIIPCFNEADNIGKVLEAFDHVELPLYYQYNVAVINDCSTDATLSIAGRYNVLTLDLSVNLGIGGAMQTGFKYAHHLGYDFAIQLDGDGQHPPSELYRLIAAMEQNPCDVVIGSRFISGEGFQSSRLRRMGIAYFKWLNRLLTGKTIHDCTSGFRMLNRKALQLVSQYYPDDYPEPESIVLYALNDLKIGEVQVLMKERQGGISSINAITSVYYMLKVSLAIFYTFIRIKYRIRWKGFKF